MSSTLLSSNRYSEIGVPGFGVRTALFSHGSEYLLILVNEDAHRHLGVDITGIGVLNGRRLELLYGSESVKVASGGFVTRLQGHEVKIFATNPRFTSSRRDGRDYGGERGP